MIHPVLASRYNSETLRMVVYEQEIAGEIIFKAECITEALKIRRTPELLVDNSNWIDTLVEGQIVNVYFKEFNDGINWFKIGTNQYCSGHSKYMKRIEIEEPDPELPDPPPSPIHDLPWLIDIHENSELHP